MARAFNHHDAFISEGDPLPVVVKDFLPTPHWTRDKTDFPPPMRQGEARLRIACPPLVRRNGAHYERGAGGGSDPTFFVAGASPARVKRRVQWRAINPPLGGVAPSTVIPGGKAERLKTRTRVVLLNLACPEQGHLAGLGAATDPPRQGNAPSPPSEHAGARTGRSGHRPPPPGVTVTGSLDLLKTEAMIHSETSHKIRMAVKIIPTSATPTTI